MILAAVAAASVTRALIYGKAKAPKLTSASPAVLEKLGAVTAAEQDEVGLPSSVVVPSVVRGAPDLTIDRRPAAIYIGAEFCPDCAAFRWAVVMALDRFGRFSGLRETTSSPWMDDPSTPTFSFYGSRYSSKYLTLVTVEREGNDTDGPGTRTDLQPLTALESRLWSHYEAYFGQQESFPFFDIGNKVFVLGPGYDPAVLARLNQRQVAADLSRPASSVARDIIGTANYLTAAICSITAGLPAPACEVAAVRRAARVLKLR